jgi:hypothetical protein
MEPSNPKERAAYKKAATLDHGEDTSNMTPEASKQGVFLEGVSEGDVSFLVTILAILTSEGDLWLDKSILAAPLHGDALERCSRLLTALAPQAKTNAELAEA